MAKLSKRLKDLLTKKPGELARKALSNPKLANRIKNRLLLPIKKDGILPSGKSVKDFSSTSYVNRRKELAKYNKTSRFFKASFSNMTFTGRFLNSFKGLITESVSKLGSSKVVVEIGPTGDHKPYKRTKTHVNFKEGETISNEQLGQYLIDSGRDYTVVNDQNKKKIAKSLKAAILKEFKLNLKRK